MSVSSGGLIFADRFKRCDCMEQPYRLGDVRTGSGHLRTIVAAILGNHLAVETAGSWDGSSHRSSAIQATRIGSAG